MQRQDWGQVDYAEACERQLWLVEQVAAGAQPDTIVFCTHPPVVTLGRSVQTGDVFAWSGEVVETSRGGRATYHGPSQIVVYPIIKLDRTDREILKARDLHQYLRSLEGAVVETLTEMGLAAEARTTPGGPGETSLTGVWVGPRKVASIGIAVKKWVAYHGVAVNLEKDPRAFSGIRPCGFQTETMVSVEELTGQRPDREDFSRRLFAHLHSRMS